MAHQKYRRRSMWRLALACGHTAYALDSEPHAAGGVFVCQACGPARRSRVTTVAELAVTPRRYRGG